MTILRAYYGIVDNNGRTFNLTVSGAVKKLIHNEKTTIFNFYRFWWYN